MSTAPISNPDPVPLRPTVGGGLPVADDDVIDLRVLVATIWRGKWLILLVSLLSLMAGVYYAFVVATPLYRASAVVILETEQNSIVDLQSVVGGLSGDTTEVNSEVEVLKARSLMGKVVDRLKLVEDPEFNASLRPVTFVNNLIKQAKTALGLEGLDIVLPEVEAKKRKRDAVISSLLEKVTVRNIPLSLVFRITAETENPEKSALLADTIVDLYILNQLEVKFEATEQATNWLSERVTELQVTLEAAEAEVKDFSANTALVSVEALQALERQLKDLRDRIETAEVTGENAAMKLQTMTVAQTPAEKALAADDSQLSSMLARVDNDARIAIAFDTRFEQLATRAQLEAQRAMQQLRALRASEIDLERQIASQGEDLIELQQLTREAEANRLLYEYFLGRLKETSAQQGIQQADSRVLSDAVVPIEPASPRKPLIVAMSMVLGLMIGIGLVLLREARKSGFRTAGELESFTGYTVLGQIPIIPVRKRRGLLQYLNDKPTSAAVEAVRNLRTSVMLSNVDTPPQVILSTSSVPAEGKTTVSLALAHNLIGLGKSVLLMEGDIRRRTLSEYFDNIPEQGLVSALSGSYKVADCVFRPDTLDVDIMAGEKSSVNAADLFASDKFKEMMKEAREAYDFIIIDCPPVLVVPDARIIAQHADAVLFSVHWDKTSREQVEESLRMFHNSGQKITGLVLGQISARGMKRYGYGDRYGAYSNYGSRYYSN